MKENVNPSGPATKAEELFEEGQRYFGGIEAEKDKEKALELFTEAAKMGHSEAQYNVGLCHKNGKYGKTLDWKQAVYWLEKAAEGGIADAAFDLGLLYKSAIFGPPLKDYKKAAEWFERAADNGHAEAMNDLAKCYAEGKGVEKDFKKAEKLWKQSADKGCDLAKENLQTLKKVKKQKTE